MVGSLNEKIGHKHIHDVKKHINVFKPITLNSPNNHHTLAHYILLSSKSDIKINEQRMVVRSSISY